MSIARQFGYAAPVVRQPVPSKRKTAEPSEMDRLREEIRELKRALAVKDAEIAGLKAAAASVTRVTPSLIVTPTVTQDETVTRNANAERQRRYRERRKACPTSAVSKS